MVDTAVLNTGGRNTLSIPKIKKTTQKERIQRVDLNNRDVQALLRDINKTCLDTNFSKTIDIVRVFMINNAELQSLYVKKRAAMKDAGRSVQTLNDQLGFFTTFNSEIPEIARDGLSVRRVRYSPLGNGQCGVYLTRYFDVEVRYAMMQKCDQTDILVFKYFTGKCKSLTVNNLYDSKGDIEPTPNYDSHISSRQPTLKDTCFVQKIRSSIYLYEYNEECEPAKFPRHCLPLAIISLKKKIFEESGEKMAVPRSIPPSAAVISEPGPQQTGDRTVVSSTHATAAKKLVPKSSSNAASKQLETPIRGSSDGSSNLQGAPKGSAVSGAPKNSLVAAVHSRENQTSTRADSSGKIDKKLPAELQDQYLKRFAAATEKIKDQMDSKLSECLKFIPPAAPQPVMSHNDPRRLKRNLGGNMGSPVAGIDVARLGSSVTRQEITPKSVLKKPDSGTKRKMTYSEYKQWKLVSELSKSGSPTAALSSAGDAKSTKNPAPDHNSLSGNHKIDTKHDQPEKRLLPELSAAKSGGIFSAILNISENPNPGVSLSKHSTAFLSNQQANVPSKLETLPSLLPGLKEKETLPHLQVKATEVLPDPQCKTPSSESVIDAITSHPHQSSTGISLHTSEPIKPDLVPASSTAAPPQTDITILSTQQDALSGLQLVTSHTSDVDLDSEQKMLQSEDSKKNNNTEQVSQSALLLSTEDLITDAYEKPLPKSISLSDMGIESYILILGEMRYQPFTRVVDYKRAKCEKNTDCEVCLASRRLEESVTDSSSSEAFSDTEESDVLMVQSMKNLTAYDDSSNESAASGPLDSPIRIRKTCSTFLNKNLTAYDESSDNSAVSSPDFTLHAREQRSALSSDDEIFREHLLEETYHRGNREKYDGSNKEVSVRKIVRFKCVNTPTSEPAVYVHDRKAGNLVSDKNSESHREPDQKALTSCLKQTDSKASWPGYLQYLHSQAHPGGVHPGNCPVSKSFNPDNSVCKAITPATAKAKTDLGSYTQGAHFLGVATQGVATQAVPTQAVPTQAVPTQAVPTQAVATQAVATQAVATQAVATQAVPTLAVTAQYVTTHTVMDQAVTTQAVTPHTVTAQAITTHAVTAQAITTHAVTTHAVTTHAVTTHAVKTQAVNNDHSSLEAVKVPRKEPLPDMNSKSLQEALLKSVSSILSKNLIGKRSSEVVVAPPEAKSSEVSYKSDMTSSQVKVFLDKVKERKVKKQIDDELLIFQNEINSLVSVENTGYNLSQGLNNNVAAPCNLSSMRSLSNSAPEIPAGTSSVFEVANKWNNLTHNRCPDYAWNMQPESSIGSRNMSRSPEVYSRPLDEADTTERYYTMSGLEREQAAQDFQHSHSSLARSGTFPSCTNPLVDVLANRSVANISAHVLSSSDTKQGLSAVSYGSISNTAPLLKEDSNLRLQQPFGDVDLRAQLIAQDRVCSISSSSQLQPLTPHTNLYENQTTPFQSHSVNIDTKIQPSSTIAQLREKIPNLNIPTTVTALTTSLNILCDEDLRLLPQSQMQADNTRIGEYLGSFAVTNSKKENNDRLPVQEQASKRSDSNCPVLSVTTANSLEALKNNFQTNNNSSFWVSSKTEEGKNISGLGFVSVEASTVGIPGLDNVSPTLQDAEESQNGTQTPVDLADTRDPQVLGSFDPKLIWPEMYEESSIAEKCRNILKALNSGTPKKVEPKETEIAKIIADYSDDDEQDESLTIENSKRARSTRDKGDVVGKERLLSTSESADAVEQLSRNDTMLPNVLQGIKEIGSLAQRVSSWGRNGAPQEYGSSSFPAGPAFKLLETNVSFVSKPVDLTASPSFESLEIKNVLSANQRGEAKRVEEPVDKSFLLAGELAEAKKVSDKALKLHDLLMSESNERNKINEVTFNGHVGSDTKYVELDKKINEENTVFPVSPSHDPKATKIFSNKTIAPDVLSPHKPMTKVYSNAVIDLDVLPSHEPMETKTRVTANADDIFCSSLVSITVEPEEDHVRAKTEEKTHYLQAGVKATSPCMVDKEKVEVDNIFEDEKKKSKMLSGLFQSLPIAINKATDDGVKNFLLMLQKSLGTIPPSSSVKETKSSENSASKAQLDKSSGGNTNTVKAGSTESHQTDIATSSSAESVASVGKLRDKVKGPASVQAIISGINIPSDSDSNMNSFVVRQSVSAESLGSKKAGPSVSAESLNSRTVRHKCRHKHTCKRRSRSSSSHSSPSSAKCRHHEHKHKEFTPSSAAVESCCPLNDDIESCEQKFNASDKSTRKSKQKKHHRKHKAAERTLVKDDVAENALNFPANDISQLPWLQSAACSTGTVLSLGGKPYYQKKLTGAVEVKKEIPPTSAVADRHVDVSKMVNGCKPANPPAVSDASAAKPDIKDPAVVDTTINVNPNGKVYLADVPLSALSYAREKILSEICKLSEDDDSDIEAVSLPQLAGLESTTKDAQETKVKSMSFEREEGEIEIEEGELSSRENSDVNLSEDTVGDERFVEYSGIGLNKEIKSPRATVEERKLKRASKLKKHRTGEKSKYGAPSKDLSDMKAYSKKGDVICISSDSDGDELATTCSTTKKKRTDKNGRACSPASRHAFAPKTLTIVAKGDNRAVISSSEYRTIKVGGKLSSSIDGQTAAKTASGVSAIPETAGISDVRMLQAAQDANSRRLKEADKSGDRISVTVNSSGKRKLLVIKEQCDLSESSSKFENPIPSPKETLQKLPLSAERENDQDSDSDVLAVLLGETTNLDKRIEGKIINNSTVIESTDIERLSQLTEVTKLSQEKVLDGGSAGLEKSSLASAFVNENLNAAEPDVVKQKTNVSACQIVTVDNSEKAKDKSLVSSDAVQCSSKTTSASDLHLGQKLTTVAGQKLTTVAGQKLTTVAGQKLTTVAGQKLTTVANTSSLKLKPASADLSGDKLPDSSNEENKYSKISVVTNTPAARSENKSVNANDNLHNTKQVVQCTVSVNSLDTPVSDKNLTPSAVNNTGRSADKIGSKACLNRANKRSSSMSPDNLRGRSASCGRNSRSPSPFSSSQKRNRSSYKQESSLSPRSKRRRSTSSSPSPDRNGRYPLKRGRPTTSGHYRSLGQYRRSTSSSNSPHSGERRRLYSKSPERHKPGTSSERYGRPSGKNDCTELDYYSSKTRGGPDSKKPKTQHPIDLFYNVAHINTGSRSAETSSSGGRVWSDRGSSYSNGLDYTSLLQQHQRNKILGYNAEFTRTHNVTVKEFVVSQLGISVTDIERILPYSLDTCLGNPRFSHQEKCRRAAEILTSCLRQLNIPDDVMVGCTLQPVINTFATPPFEDRLEYYTDKQILLESNVIKKCQTTLEHQQMRAAIDEELTYLNEKQLNLIHQLNQARTMDTESKVKCQTELTEVRLEIDKLKKLASCKSVDTQSRIPAIDFKPGTFSGEPLPKEFQVPVYGFNFSIPRSEMTEEEALEVKIALEVTKNSILELYQTTNLGREHFRVPELLLLDEERYEMYSRGNCFLFLNKSLSKKVFIRLLSLKHKIETVREDPSKTLAEKYSEIQKLISERASLLQIHVGNITYKRVCKMKALYGQLLDCESYMTSVIGHEGIRKLPLFDTYLCAVKYHYELLNKEVRDPSYPVYKD